MSRPRAGSPEFLEKVDPLMHKQDIEVQFLLAEFERLKALEVQQLAAHYARFNFFMTVVLAIIAAYVTLASATAPVIAPASPLPEVLAVLILIWGLFTFMELTDNSSHMRHLINAMHAIENYFVELSPALKWRLYYRSGQLWVPPSRLEGVLSRWVLRGSPKQVLAVLDSGIVAALVGEFLRAQGTDWLATMVIALLVFVCSGMAHFGYVKLMYSRKYIAST